jgi:single-strand DNA-binding protein
MSGTLAQVAIVGRLTRDAELKYIPSGLGVMHFSVATSDRSKKGTEWIDEPSFWDCELWGKQAETLAQYMTKGKQIALSGSMRIESWEKDGVKKSKTKVTAQTIALLGGDKHEEKRDKPQSAPSEPGFSDDDPPF